jgi:Fe-S-cluster containining protein
MMSVDPAAKSSTVSATFTISDESFNCSFRVTVPAGPATLADLLPIARSLSDAIVQATVTTVEQAGEKISCGNGCSACCNILIAVSEVEAQRISDLVQALPEPRKGVVLRRFSEARDQLERASLLEPLQTPERCTKADYARLDDEYFRLGVPCPFLEQQSCSIYEERPLTCREHLVTSPPALCAQVGSTGVRKVKLPFTVFNAIARVGVPSQGALSEKWVPLILAPEWAKTHTEPPEIKPGLELLQELLAHANS